MDIDPITRADFIQNVYKAAELHLGSLMDNPNDTAAEDKLAQLNDSIKEMDEADTSEVPEAERAKAIIDVPTFVEKFRTAKPFYDSLVKDPTDAAARRVFNKINESLKDFNQEHGYPETWVMHVPQETETSADQKTKKVQPGLTRKGEPILACRKVLGGHRFYVETEANGLPFCEVRTSEEVGLLAAKAYLEHDKKVDVGEGARKYRRKDAELYERIVHVACKPVHTRTEPKDKSRQPRRPLTDVYAIIDGEARWITSSDLTAMCGKVDAWADIEEYYDVRKEEYPWEVPPKRILKVVEQQEAGEAPSSGAPTRDSSGSNDRSSKDDEIQQLREENTAIRTQLDKLTELMTVLVANKT